MTVGPMTEDVIKAGGGLIHATVLKMNDDEGRDLAEAIASFAYSFPAALSAAATRLSGRRRVKGASRSGRAP